MRVNNFAVTDIDSSSNPNINFPVEVCVNHFKCSRLYYFYLLVVFLTSFSSYYKRKTFSRTFSSIAKLDYAILQKFYCNTTASRCVLQQICNMKNSVVVFRNTSKKLKTYICSREDCYPQDHFWYFSIRYSIQYLFPLRREMHQIIHLSRIFYYPLIRD